ncbi:MAG: hypothetical protein WB538_18245, partial [Candidatus Sulfotelmatobacter sp.]
MPSLPGLGSIYLFPTPDLRPGLTNDAPTGLSAFRAFEESQGFAFQKRYLREVLMTAGGEAFFHLGQVQEIFG